MYDKQLSAEFRSEIETLSKIEHLNLVRFLGYLEHEDERLIMVEYVNNGSLREHLDGRYHFFNPNFSFLLLKILRSSNIRGGATLWQRGALAPPENLFVKISPIKLYF